MQRLHTAEAAAYHRRELRNAEQIGKPRLGFHPVVDRDHRKGGAIRFTGCGVYAGRPGRTVAAAEVVNTNDEEAIGVDGFTRADHVVPPTGVFVLLAVITGDVMRAGKRVTDQDRVAFVGVELAIGFVHQFVVRQASAAAQRNGLFEARRLRRNNTDRCGVRRMHV